MKPVPEGIRRTRMVWRAMLNRCTKPACKDFARYGARGITVCQEWMTFDRFLADMGEHPAGMTLERNDNARGYSPENCRWATRQDQAENRSSTRWIEHNGERKTQRQWARDIGISEQTLSDRLLRGWPTNLAISKAASASNSVLKKEATRRRKRLPDGRLA